MAGFFEWIATSLGQGDDVAAARAAELEAQEGREAGLERRPETNFGTSTPVRDPATGSELDPATGRPFDRTVGGTETRDDAGFGWSWLSESWRKITGETTTATGVDDVRGREVTAISEDRTTRELSPTGGASISHVEGTRTEVLDAPAMAAEVSDVLELRRDAKREELAQVDAELAALDTRRAAAPPDQQATIEQERARLAARQASLTSEVRGLETDIAVLAQDNLGERGLLRITQAHGVEVRPQYTTDTEDRTTTSASAQLDGVGASAAASHETRTVADGTTQTDTLAATGSVDLLGASAEAGVSATSVTEHDDVTDTASASRTASLGASEGRITAGVTDSASFSSADSDGNVSSGASDSHTRSGSLIASDDELGVAVGDSRTSSVTSDGVTAARTDASSTSITDHGVAHSASTDRSIGSSHTEDDTTTTWRGGAKTSTDGSFTVNVEAVEGTLPARYRVTMSLSAGAGLTLSGSAGRETEAAGGNPASSASASASGGATASVQMTYTHVMGEAEARQYMLAADQADAGESAASAEPEFGLLSRLRALANEGDNAAVGGAAVLGSSAAATELGAGESIELTLTGGVSGSLEAGASRGGFGASVDASGSMTATRRVRVESVSDSSGRQLVDVTVTFIDASTHRAGGSATIEGVTAGGHISGAESDTQAATVRLDTASPEYAGQYHQVCAALSIDDVRALARTFTDAHSETAGHEVSVGAGGATLTMGSESTESSSVTRTGDTLSGTMSGGVTDSAAISVADTDVLQGTERNTAVGTVDSAGLDVRLEHEETSSDPLRAIGEGWDAFTGWVTGEHDAADLARAAATSPEERLREQLETTYARLEEYSLSEPDIDVLVGRAGNTDLWSRCARSHHVLDAWASLRGELITPTPDAEWVTIDPANAARLARARSLASFMSSTGSRGMETMENCMRHWGEGASIGDLSIGSADDLAVYREWPNSIVEQRTTLLTARSRIRTADEHLATLIGPADGQSRAQAWRDDTLAKLEEVQTAITGCADFEHPRAKLEMLDEISRLRRELEAAWARNEHALSSGVAESAPAPAPPADGGASSMESMESESESEPLTSSPDEVCVDPAQESAAITAPPTDAQVADRARMGDLVGLLAEFKTQESALFAQARGMMTVEMGGTIDGTWDYMWNGDEMGAVELMSEVAELHEAWITRIVELRGIYGSLATPTAQWVVSTGPGARRNADHEPDGATLYTIYTIDTGSLQSNAGLSERRIVARQWRDRAHDY